VRTDRDGRFRVEGLVPGVTYRIADGERNVISGDLSVKAGETKDLGDLRPRSDE
jgi:hypothetical protein